MRTSLAEERIRDDHTDEEGNEREGTVWTATAHCITTIIGSGVLALPWSVAQLGWIWGPITLLAFAAITYYTSALLADCYRSPDPINGTRNPTYMSCVQSYLGPKNVLLCCISQYTNLWGGMVSYTITTATSMRDILRANGIHNDETKQPISGNLSMILFGAISLLLSLFPDLGEITWLSVLAAVMSFGYSIISLYLCSAKLISQGNTREFLMEIMSRNDAIPSTASKTWSSFQALGNIAFAYSYAAVLIEIQDTLRSPPSENITMRKAGLYGISITTIFYVTIGCLGYAAFGNATPGNILTAFDEPFWLVDLANIFIVVHLLGAYQVCAQPIFDIIEKMIASNWPELLFFQTAYTIRVPFTRENSLPVMPSRIIIRWGLVVFTTLVSIFLPFFNAIMGWIGAAGFWPLTVYLPINMYLSQKNIGRGVPRWFLLHGLSTVSLLVCFAAIAGSTAGIIDSLKDTNRSRADY